MCIKGKKKPPKSLVTKGKWLQLNSLFLSITYSNSRNRESQEKSKRGLERMWGFGWRFCRARRGNTLMGSLWIRLRNEREEGKGTCYNPVTPGLWISKYKPLPFLWGMEPRGFYFLLTPANTL